MLLLNNFTYSINHDIINYANKQKEWLEMGKVLVETSARHVHVTEKDLETLFGKGYQLTKKKDLSQPGQFACEERVTVVGEKKSLPGVSILGPCRKRSGRFP